MIGRTEDDATARKIAQHMTHKASTAQAHYFQLQGTATSLEAYEIINRKRAADGEEDVGEPPLPPPKKRMRRTWATEEEDALKAHFSLGPERNPPSVPDCREFLAECRATGSSYFVGRDPHEIKDKCRTILRQLKRQ